jgi:hypothetical protein
MYIFDEKEKNKMYETAAELIKEMDDTDTNHIASRKVRHANSRITSNLSDTAIKVGLYGLTAIVEAGSKVKEYLIDPVFDPILNKVPSKVKYGAAAITTGVAMSFTGGAAKLIPTDVSEILDSHIDIGNPFDIPAAYALEINESSGKDVGKVIKNLGSTKQAYASNSTALAASLAALNYVPVPLMPADETKKLNKRMWHPVQKLEGDVIEITYKKVLENYRKTDTAIVTRAEMGPDALAAIAYADATDAPILLVEEGRYLIKANIILNKLGVKNTVIFGGPEAVSEYTEQMLSLMSPDVTRIEGKDRYETAVKAAEATMSKAKVDTLVIAYGDDPSILTANAAKSFKAPVLYLLRGENATVIPDVTKDFLVELSKCKNPKYQHVEKIIGVDLAEDAEKMLKDLMGEITFYDLVNASNNIDENEYLLTPRELLARETNEMIRESYYGLERAKWEYEDSLLDLNLKIHSKHGEYPYGAVEKASKEATKLRVKSEQKNADYEQVISSIKERQIEDVFQPEWGEWHGLQETALDEWVKGFQISNETLRKLRNLENGALKPLEVKTWPNTSVLTVPCESYKECFKLELGYRKEVAAYYGITLRPYQQSRNAILLMPKDPSSYVDPDNPIVEKFAKAYYDSHDKQGDEIDSVNMAWNFDRKFKWFTDRVLYGFTSDYHENPEFTLMIGAGDCDAQSYALASMLISKGRNAKVIGFVNYNGNQEGGGLFGHFGVEFKGEDNRIYFADTIGIADVRENRMDTYNSFERVAFQFSNDERLNSYDKHWYQSDEQRHQRLSTINLVTGPSSRVGRIISMLEKEGEDVTEIREARDIVYRAAVNPDKNGGVIEDWSDSRVVGLENALNEIGYTIYE